MLTKNLNMPNSVAAENDLKTVFFKLWLEPTVRNASYPTAHDTHVYTTEVSKQHLHLFYVMSSNVFYFFLVYSFLIF